MIKKRLLFAFLIINFILFSYYEDYKFGIFILLIVVEANEDNTQKESVNIHGDILNEENIENEKLENIIDNNILNNNNNIPKVKILYCTAWNMKQGIQQIAQYLRENYPEIVLDGEPYPIPLYVQVLSKFVGAFNIFLMINIFTSFSLLGYLGVSNGIIEWLNENKQMFIFLPFVLSSIIGSLTNTGAFELYVNDILEFSKLETGRFPTKLELTKIFSKYGL